MFCLFLIRTKTIYIYNFWFLCQFEYWIRSTEVKHGVPLHRLQVKVRSSIIMRFRNLRHPKWPNGNRLLSSHSHIIEVVTGISKMKNMPFLEISIIIKQKWNFKIYQLYQWPSIRYRDNCTKSLTVNCFFSRLLRWPPLCWLLQSKISQWPVHTGIEKKKELIGCASMRA